MLRVGITGGIGSGKSMVCQVFKTLGIPVFYADKAGRYLMDHDASVIDAIKVLFGEGIYRDGILDREKMASIVFNSPEKLSELNSIVHPATIRYGIHWMDMQQSPYVVKEAAIFFESGSYKDMDIMIGVFAPLQLRIQRARQRDSVSEEKILQRMAHQMDENEKMSRCDYVITNDDKVAIIPQVLNIHGKLLELVGKKIKDS